MCEVGIWGPNVVRPHLVAMSLLKKGNATSKIRSCSHGDFWIFNSASVERFEKGMAAFSPYRFSVIGGDREELRLPLAEGTGQ